MTDRYLEAYEAWNKEQNSAWSYFKKTLQPAHMLAILSITLFAWWLVKNDKINTTYAMIGIILIIALVLFRSKKSVEKELLPEDVVKAIVILKIRDKIGVTDEFPFGTRIYELVYCNLQWQGKWGEDFRAWKWEVGVKVIKPNKLIEILKVTVSPFNGVITGMKLARAGFYGEKSYDLRILTPPVLAVKDEKKSQI